MREIKKRILFVEDDEQYRKLIKDILIKSNYSVDAVGSAIEGIEIFEKNKYDLVISDLKLEELDGTKFIKFIKKVDTKTRTMILTASPTAESELEALELNIDKYVLKETRVDVLLKYVEFLILLAEDIDSNERVVITSAREGIIVDIDARTVIQHGEQIDVTNKQFGILKILLENMGAAVSRDRMIDELWDQKYEEIDTRIIDGHIKELRKKLNIQSIVSIRGYGYKWTE